MTKNKIVLLFYILLCSIKAFAQENNMEVKYFIFSFSEKYKMSQHKEKIFYWIVPAANLKQSVPMLHPLLIDGFSLNNLIDCKNNDTISIGEMTSNTSYKFDYEYYKQLDSLKDILTKRRSKIQKIKKIWISGQSQKINIYVTEVTGIFITCQCILNKGQDVERIYIPLSSFKYLPNITETNGVIKTLDVSDIKYNLFPK